MSDSVMAFAFLGELVCVMGLLFLGAIELWRWGHKAGIELWSWWYREPVEQPDHHADLMRKYNCLMSDAECDEMHSDRWGGD